MTTSFADFVEATDAFFRRFLSFFHKGTFGVVDDIIDEVNKKLPFDRSHVFYLGEDGLAAKFASDIAKDIAVEYAAHVLHVPFDDLCIVTRDNNVADAPCVGEKVSGTLPPRWVADRIITLEENRFYVIRYERYDGAQGGVVTAWSFIYDSSFMNQDGRHMYKAGCSPFVTCAVEKDGSFIQLAKSQKEQQALTYQVRENDTVILLNQVICISHPANYIVKVNPALTEKERRGVDKYGIPARKRPHFIIVDHDVLVRMKSGQLTEEERQSPVPHHRRGHWRNLAERCRHARMFGGEKVWIRPAFIGDRTFSDDRNYYEVLMDFSQKGSQVK